MQDQTVTTAELCSLLDLDRSSLSRLAADGVLPKRRRDRWPAASCVRSYVQYLHGLTKRTGNGNLAAADDLPCGPDVDPDTLPVGARLRYWQAVRARQQSMEHLQEVIDELAEEYRRQTGEAVQKIRTAIEAAGLTPEQLETIRAAVTKGFAA